MRSGRAIVLAVLAACSPSARERGGPSAVDIDVSDAAAPKAVEVTATTSQACIIRTAKTNLDVKIDVGKQPFSIRVIGHPTIAELERGPEVVVRVTDPIELEGTATPHFVTGRELSVEGGLVKLAANVEVVEPVHVAAQSSAIATVRPGGLDISDVRVTCEALELRERAPSAANQVAPPADRRLVQAAKLPLTLCASTKNDAPCIQLRDELVLERVADADGFVEVRATFTDGSGLHGFVRAEAIVPTKEFPVVGAVGLGVGCGCAGVHYGHSSGGYYGKARLRAGAKIFATANGATPWATVRRDFVADVSMPANDDYAQIRNVPGIGTQLGCNCPGMRDHAWIARAAVTPLK